MRSAKLVEPRKIEIVNVPDPEPGQGEVLIRVRTAGICGSDLHIYQGERADVQLPRVMGHELAGEVVALGEGVTRFSIGDRVTVDPVVSCGSCPSCKRGFPNLCSSVACLGCQVEGGFQDLVAIPEKSVYSIPADVPWEMACMMEPFSIAAEVLSRSEAKPGDRALVFGAGTIGLCILQGLKSRGVEVMITDRVPFRLEKARELDAARTVDAGQEDLAAAVAEFTDGFGLDVIVEAVGIPALFEQSLDLAAPGGRVVILGFNGEPARIPELPITRKELKVIGSRMSCLQFPTVQEWFSTGAVNPKPLLSAKYDFEDIGRAFREILEKPEEVLKAILIF